MNNEAKDSHNRFVEERKTVREDRKEHIPIIRGNLVRIIFSSHENNRVNNLQQEDNDIPVIRNRRRRYSNIYVDNAPINTTEHQRDRENIYNMIMSSGNIADVTGDNANGGNDEDEENVNEDTENYDTENEDIDNKENRDDGKTLNENKEETERRDHSNPITTEASRRDHSNPITTEASRRDRRNRVENMRQDAYNRFRTRLAEAPPLDTMFDNTDYEDEYQPRHRQDGIPCPETGVGEEAKAVVLQCSICRNNQIQTVNFPCMHACFCLECAKPSVMQSNICPQCRTQYMHISMLYLCYRDADADDIKHADKRRRLS